MLIKAITNGSKIIVSKSGTQMRFYSGMVTNNDGVVFDFDCGLHRSIGYYLEYLLLISMFGKTSLSINLTGITNDNHDNSVDSILHHLIPLLK
jgi:RNA 3'-terminal phosphate cyclase-like protein